MASQPDTAYLTFGWWVRKDEDGGYEIASFSDPEGTDDDVTPFSDAATLEGEATYNGAAAGQYALFAGGKADAGHFTADAELVVDFGNQTDVGTVTGTIDAFKGADGEDRNWTVTLEKSGALATGVFSQATEGTIWKIGDAAEDAAGSYTGTFYGLQEGGTTLQGKITKIPCKSVHSVI